MAMLSAQEHGFAGSTPDIIPQAGSPDWFRPQGLVTGQYTPEEIGDARNKKQYVKNPLIGLALGIRSREGSFVGFSLAELDPTTGATVEDPVLMDGEWKPDVGKIVGRDITKEFMAANASAKEDERVEIPMREFTQNPEGVTLGHPEKG